MNEKTYLDYDGLERYHDLLLQQLETKTDKVNNSTSGNFASLNNDGNIADSGHAHSDYVLKTDLEEIEEVVSASLNDLNTRIPDLSDYITNSDLESSIESCLKGSSSIQIISDNTSASVPSEMVNGEQRTVIYYNNSSSTNYTVTLSKTSTIKTPNNNDIILTIPANGYCEINYMMIDNIIYARGV